MEKQNYYAVTAKCGHVGKGKYVEVTFPVIASSRKKASDLVRNKPRVKRDHKHAIIDVIRIDYEEFLALKEKNLNNPYLYCKNIQEQRTYCPDIYEEVKDLYEVDDYEEKREKRLIYLFKKRKSFERRFTESDYSYSF